jgi:shikimate dehydrogenase
VLQHSFEQGARGLNLTLPHKAAACAMVAELSPAARRAGAINTLVRCAQGWRGENTDGIGLVRDLRERHRLPLQDARVLILGAGGAARGVIQPLLDAGAQLALSNRTHSRAQALAAEFQGAALACFKLSELASAGRFDLVLNASASGHQGQFPELPESALDADGALYDLSYGEAALPALRFASERECRGFDGLGMLIEQAAEAFYLWHGVRVDTAPVWGMLRAL